MRKSSFWWENILLTNFFIIWSTISGSNKIFKTEWHEKGEIFLERLLWVSIISNEFCDIQGSRKIKGKITFHAMANFRLSCSFFLIFEGETLDREYKWSPRKVIQRGKQGNFGERGAISLSMLVLGLKKLDIRFQLVYT